MSDKTTSTILDSEYIEKDIRGAAMLVDNVSRQLFNDGYIVEDDYLALQIISKTLLDDIAPRTKKLIEASYELLKARKER